MVVPSEVPGGGGGAEAAGQGAGEEGEEVGRQEDILQAVDWDDDMERAAREKQRQEMEVRCRKTAGLWPLPPGQEEATGGLGPGQVWQSHIGNILLKYTPLRHVRHKCLSERGFKCFESLVWLSWISLKILFCEA